MAKSHPIITPDQVRQKAERLYPQFVRGWLAETNQFPLVLRASLPTSGSDLPGAIAAVEQLRSAAKERRGFGYTVHWRMVRSRTLGENRFPRRIEIETPEDLLRLIDRRSAFSRLQRAVEKIRATLPNADALEAWFAVKANWEKLEDASLDVDGLLAVTRYFLDHPQPDCFARELPVPVDTKFIERNSTILRAWLDCLLPSSAIDVNEKKFARRFGLRDGDQHYLIRVLDSQLCGELGLPFDEFSLPLRHFRALPVSEATVIIVENKVNLLTLPARHRTLGMGGVGNGVNRFGTLPWLKTSRILYWGDIDVDGFRILSSLRNWLPHTESFLMNLDVLDRFSKYTVSHVAAPGATPSNLNAAEQLAYDRCLREGLRLEQEHLPGEFVSAAIPD